MATVSNRKSGNASKLRNIFSGHSPWMAVSILCWMAAISGIFYSSHQDIRVWEHFSSTISASWAWPSCVVGGVVLVYTVVRMIKERSWADLSKYAYPLFYGATVFIILWMAVAIKTEFRLLWIEKIQAENKTKSIVAETALQNEVKELWAEAAIEMLAYARSRDERRLSYSTWMSFYESFRTIPHPCKILLRVSPDKPRLAKFLQFAIFKKGYGGCEIATESVTGVPALLSSGVRVYVSFLYQPNSKVIAGYVTEGAPAAKAAFGNTLGLQTTFVSTPGMPKGLIWVDIGPGSPWPQEVK